MISRLQKQIQFKFLLTVALFTALPLLIAQCTLAAAEENCFYSLSAKSIDGKVIDFSSYRGKVILAVNVASQCGFTPQYSGLEKLYKKFKNREFIIFGFPSNDFGGQEPGTDAEIKKFCSLNYQVKFPVFSKGPVTGDNKIPVYKFLAKYAPGDQQGEVKWNFEKFLIDKKGHVVRRFRSSIEPDDAQFIGAIEKEIKTQ